MGRRRYGRWGIAARLAPGLALAVGAAGFLWYVGPQTAGATVVYGFGTIVTDITSGSTVTLSAIGNVATGTIKVGTFTDTDGSTPTEFQITIYWGGGQPAVPNEVPLSYTPYGPPTRVTCRFNNGQTTCTVFGTHTYFFSGTYTPELYVADSDETGYVVITGGAVSGTTTASKASCIPYTHFCHSRVAQPGEAVTVASQGVTATSVGRGEVAVGTYGKSPTVPVTASTDKFFAVQLSSSNAFTSLTVNDCNLGGGTHLEWWNGTAWQPVVGTTTTSPGGNCLSVTLGAKSSPTLATIAKLSRLTRLEAVAFAVTI